jgi:hypothetical protein
MTENLISVKLFLVIFMVLLLRPHFPFSNPVFLFEFYRQAGFSLLKSCFPVKILQAGRIFTLKCQTLSIILFTLFSGILF